MEKIINSLKIYLYGDSEKQAIIFVHGFPYDHTMWMNQINELQRDYFCVTYDIRGLGQSYVGDGQYTMEAYVDDLYSIIDELKLVKPVLCGLSMGGYITFRTLESARVKFGGAILCDTKSDADTDKEKLIRASKINQINVEGLDKFVESFVPNCFSDLTIKNKPELFNDVLNKSKQHNPIGVKGALFAMLSRTSTKKFLKKIDFPTLILVGKYDKLTPPKTMRKIAESILHSEFKIVPNAGHMTPIENPEFVTKSIKDFLSIISKPKL